MNSPKQHMFLFIFYFIDIYKITRNRGLMLWWATPLNFWSKTSFHLFILQNCLELEDPFSFLSWQALVGIFVIIKADEVRIWIKFILWWSLTKNRISEFWWFSIWIWITKIIFINSSIHFSRSISSHENIFLYWILNHHQVICLSLN